MSLNFSLWSLELQRDIWVNYINIYTEEILWCYMHCWAGPIPIHNKIYAKQRNGTIQFNDDNKFDISIYIKGG